PQPQNGGKTCSGINTEVTNCTVHGGWTEWSAWSSCSQTCGVAIKTRRRSCGNPKPAHGGRTCVGSEHNEMYCQHLPPCPIAKPQGVDGGWGPWGDWSDCTAQCGGGFRIRRRECNNPSPQNGGQECAGCHTDYEICNIHECAEVKKLSSWTPWLVQNNETKDGTHVERRFRFACKAITMDSSSLRITLAKEESRVCRADGSCQRHANEEEVPDHVPEWGPCSVSCGGGTQHRLVEGKQHRGRHSQSRICNTSACPISANLNEVILAHEWSCWTDWSPCSVSCGVGIKRRTRKCLGGHEKLCNGRAVDEEKCEMRPCEDYLGWSDWSEWSDCSSEGIRFRHRKCIVEAPESGECRGNEFEKTACVPGFCEGTQMASSTTLATIIALVILLYVLTIFMTFWFTRRHFMPQVPVLKNNTPTSSYDSYPNQYSSLPTKDYDVRPKVKRQSSFTACSPSKHLNTGTLNRNNMNHNHTPKVLAKTYNDCETGTLKRNSHALNNYRTNIDDEKF
ncbi:semaphorin-5A-like, partial [Teleopsis dalmanni]|uniref:semaphorin-5A-like n=1 Tax=Teleopsis dalmanni TaxID=139649 RepID=UPI0018CFC4AF